MEDGKNSDSFQGMEILAPFLFYLIFFLYFSIVRGTYSNPYEWDFHLGDPAVILCLLAQMAMILVLYLLCTMPHTRPKTAQKALFTVAFLLSGLAILSFDRSPLSSSLVYVFLDLLLWSLIISISFYWIWKENKRREQLLMGDLRRDG